MADKRKPARAAADAGDPAHHDDDAGNAPAKKTSETIHEFVLYQREGDDRKPLYSDADAAVVEQARINAIADAARLGRPRPDLFVTDRQITFPLAGGKRQAQGSTCEESEVEAE